MDTVFTLSFYTALFVLAAGLAAGIPKIISALKDAEPGKRTGLAVGSAFLFARFAALYLLFAVTSYASRNVFASGSYVRPAEPSAGCGLILPLILLYLAVWAAAVIYDFFASENGKSSPLTYLFMPVLDMVLIPIQLPGTLLRMKSGSLAGILGLLLSLAAFGPALAALFLYLLI